MPAFNYLVCLVSLAIPVLTQYPSPPLGITNVQSKLQPGVEITYKETHVCETTPGVKSFSGYVHLPAEVLGDVGDYNISTFFWYFEARHNPKTAPLAIYLAGGPGEPSIYSALAFESGPCYVNLNSNSTSLNPWSFNNHVNMLYVDQPAQTGFSYSSLVNGTIDLDTGDVTSDDTSNGALRSNSTVVAGTFADQDPLKTANTSITSAKALWHFAENWLTQFPQYKPEDKRISVWGNSYGGYWAPAVVAYFDKQLKALEQDHQLCGFKMDTLGITNGCIDMLYSVPSYPAYAHNNTYDLQLFSDNLYVATTHNFTKPGGCRDLILQCRVLGEQGDANWTGNNKTVNEACTLATQYCFAYVIGDLQSIANRSNFDIAVTLPDPCPFYAPVDTFLNTAWVQSALGVPLNFTLGSNVVLEDYSFSFSGANNYLGTGDAFRRSSSELEYALQNEIKVAMVFGDRDYRCNWLGGEATALGAKWSGREGFVGSGYERIVTNGSYEGGVVKQYSTLSFSRVFEAGHSVSAYQPETVYQVFMRAMFDRDIATGRQSRNGYKSVGLESSDGIRNVLPPPPESCRAEVGL